MAGAVPGEMKMPRPCKYLQGKNLVPLTAAKVKALVGHKIEYLQFFDIDRSGRGYFFPKTGIVLGSYRKHIEINIQNNFMDFGSFAEIVDRGVVE
jgi:hypothetical protein